MSYLPQDGQTIFNAGIAILKRIDVLESQIHESRILKNFAVQYDCLLGIFAEIAPVLSDAEITQCEELIKLCQKTNPFAATKKEPPYVYDSGNMLKLEILLNRLQQGHGMRMPKQGKTSFTDT